MKEKRSIWKVLITVFVIAALTATIFAATGVFASLADSTKVITMKDGSASCRVDKNYTIHNTGNVPVLLRAKIVLNWLDEDGSVLAIPPEDASVSIKTSSAWVQFPAGSKSAEDGYWYYTGVLAPEAAASLIDSISFTGNSSAALKVLAEVIQSTPAQAASDAWGMTYTNGTWAKK